MSDGAAIADLEAEIERLSEAAERCRKTIVAARCLWLGGAVAFAAILLGAFGGAVEGLVAALAALVGGLSLDGSSRGTLRDLESAVRRLETERNAAIDAIGLRPAAAALPPSDLTQS